MKAGNARDTGTDRGKDITPPKIGPLPLTFLTCLVVLTPPAALLALWTTGEPASLHWLLFLPPSIWADLFLIQFLKRTKHTRLYELGAFTERNWLSWSIVDAVEFRHSGIGIVLRMRSRQEVADIDLGVFKKPLSAMQVIEGQLPSHLEFPKWVVKRFKLPPERATPKSTVRI